MTEPIHAKARTEAQGILSTGAWLLRDLLPPPHPCRHAEGDCACRFQSNWAVNSWMCSCLRLWAYEV